ncbi:MAG: hypothetical protein Q4E05_10250 [Pseudoclavibacter sp.]|nr:hypothetical protein [Pseudoclavibacter sp.]
MSPADSAAGAISVVAYGVVAAAPETAAEGCRFPLFVPAAADGSEGVEQQVLAVTEQAARLAACLVPGDRVFVRGTLTARQAEPAPPPAGGDPFLIEAEGLALELPSRQEGAAASAPAGASDADRPPAPAGGGSDPLGRLAALSSEHAAGGRFHEAVRAAELALAACPRGSEAAEVRARLLRRLAAALGNAGQEAAAVERLREAVRSAPGSDAPLLEAAAADLALALSRCGEPEAARAACLRHLEAARTRPDGVFARLRALQRLSEIEFAAGRAGAALEACREQIETLSTVPGGEDDRVRALHRFARLCEGLGDPAAAERTCRAAIRLAGSCSDPEGQEAEGRRLLAALLLGRGDPGAAAAECGLAVDALRTRPGRDAEFAAVLLLKSIAHERAGESGAAIEAMATALEPLRALPGQAEVLLEVLGDLGEALLRAGRGGQARPVLVEQLRMLRGRPGTGERRRLLLERLEALGGDLRDGSPSFSGADE